jgi:NADH-quinone oxidoreductase subunit H
MVTVSAMATTLFLGGWRAPWPISLWEGANQGWVPMIWFFGKVSVFIFVFIWLRGTLPRLRYDQFMKFGWKFLLPVSIGWIVIVATARALRAENNWDLAELARTLVGPMLALVVIVWIAEEIRERRKAKNVTAAPAPVAEFDPFAGGHPVPPMPGQALPSTSSLTAQES